VQERKNINTDEKKILHHSNSTFFEFTSSLLSEYDRIDLFYQSSLLERRSYSIYVIVFKKTKTINTL